MVAHQQGDTQCLPELERSGRTGDGETHLSAMRNTLDRVASDTSSGRVNDLDTVETDTFAALATS